MMSASRVYVILAVCWCFLNLSATPAAAYVEFKSGEYTPVDYVINDTIAIDYTASPDPGTHVDLLDGGRIQGAVYAYNDAEFTLNGGSVYGRLFAHDDARASIKGGFFSISDNHVFFGYENSLVEFYGSSFAVDGTPVGYGDSLKDYATYNGTFYHGLLTGRLSDGSSIANEFYLYQNADMIVAVPEPGVGLLTVLMGGGLACCFGRRRR
jgi:hypothetical protein